MTLVVKSMWLHARRPNRRKDRHGNLTTIFNYTYDGLEDRSCTLEIYADAGSNSTNRIHFPSQGFTFSTNLDCSSLKEVEILPNQDSAIAIAHACEFQGKWKSSTCMWRMIGIWEGRCSIRFALATRPQWVWWIYTGPTMKTLLS